uniref:NADH dehydrogenase subunit 1 n=1 Tax=Apachyus feae TaxID=2914707 RepID=UPI001EF9D44E|nr:NADH dehydrogenase subunit 1 [Apachyus feae]UKE80573.1 NADH dehydrogenase subunit 1 [Apachyus feae]
MIFMDYTLSVLSIVVLILGVLVGVAFLTLLERKILGYIQIRKGPNKVGFMGLLQPFSDAVKLFSKEQSMPLVSNFLPYYYAPVASLLLSLVSWFVFSGWFLSMELSLGSLFLLSCLSLGVYTLMIAGWSSNSSYSLLGGVRAMAQTISYEVSLALILMVILLMVGSLNLGVLHSFQMLAWFVFLVVPLACMWFISSLAETNRTPFDLAEGESELVSGFNVEYSSVGFALIFMAEYSMILFMSLLFVYIFLGGEANSLVLLKFMVVAFTFVWVRGTLPRFRYDSLMQMCWLGFLPVVLNFFVFMIGLKVFLSVALD